MLGLSWWFQVHCTISILNRCDLTFKGWKAFWLMYGYSNERKLTYASTRAIQYRLQRWRRRRGRWMMGSFCCCAWPTPTSKQRLGTPESRRWPKKLNSRIQVLIVEN